ncbi:MAG: N-formylglutamate amidohydrolase [Hyphomicrobiaceae bacterium]
MTTPEIHSLREELTPAFVIARPEAQTAPIVFCSPHSGSCYPAALLSRSRLDARSLRKSEDCYVDELFACAHAHGAPLIAARFPRAYLDVNREPYELDPELITGVMPGFANTRSMRVAGGLGTIARIVADGEEIYRGRIDIADALNRIELLYKPFHAALAQLIEATRKTFGYAILIDCHSMPSTSINHNGASRPDFVLGDRFGSSCDARVSQSLRATLEEVGFRVHLNRPYAGGFITEHYGRPHQRVHAVQIEMNRGLYLDEQTLDRLPAFPSFAASIEHLVRRLTRELPSVLERRAAAE